jgi:Phosphoesterase family
MTRHHPLVRALAATALVAGGLISGSAISATTTAHAVVTTAKPALTGSARGARVMVRPGRNLLVNPGAEVGDASRNGWSTVTIPGWRVASGLPTVVHYGNKGFPGRRSTGPRNRGRQMFVGGAGGTSRLLQDVPLRDPAGGPLPWPTRFSLSAWVGGSSTSNAVVAARFFTADHRALTRWRSLSVVSAGRTGGGGLRRRAVTGVVPRAARFARVAIELRTSLTNDDGYNAPLVGYNHAVADDVRLTVASRARRPPRLVPPVAHVPRFDHVFLYFFENEDYGSIVGNTRRAPFWNSLIPQGSLLADSFAEEHPSDGNYLAIAGGSTFGIPLTDPLEENPRFTVDARNLGDLIVGAHETWKDYAQGMNGPCDDTVHGSYWNDDPEFMYFRDVRTRPAYCAQHLVPLNEMTTDLQKASTTPNFVWVEPDDCTDMEGCGIKAGDNFLKQTFGEIRNSPAWKTQRSLLIITFDEDDYDHERPAQLIPSIVLGSEDVKRGFVSHTRYTHYSMLRTIEAALGLGTLTQNDRYAQPLNDVFHVAS